MIIVDDYSILDKCTVNGRISKKLCEKLIIPQIEKLQDQNKELLELLKEADSLIDDYLNWRDEKRMDYFDIRARKLREALGELIHHCGDYGITSESFAICMAVNQAVQAIEKVSKRST